MKSRWAYIAPFVETEIVPKVELAFFLRLTGHRQIYLGGPVIVWPKRIEQRT